VYKRNLNSFNIDFLHLYISKQNDKENENLFTINKTLNWKGSSYRPLSTHHRSQSQFSFQHTTKVGRHCRDAQSVATRRHSLS
jgi:hypothetical protein